jgi:hypothetical protein
MGGHRAANATGKYERGGVHKGNTGFAVTGATKASGAMLRGRGRRGRGRRGRGRRGRGRFTRRTRESRPSMYGALLGLSLLGLLGLKCTAPGWASVYACVCISIDSGGKRAQSHAHIDRADRADRESRQSAENTLVGRHGAISFNTSVCPGRDASKEGECQLKQVCAWPGGEGLVHEVHSVLAEYAREV